ncbi:MAG: 5-amino-6-(D-ribitylamino)uracil--L-tyrosine 4-hydroxyphenyl transferase CofH [Emcibacter sp.]|nr:5-amino-6-(D-ribitylamino)uracil--L-tyrosine 4-hydroxyphenyl transferase CofH [Emcibacter sp.]
MQSRPDEIRTFIASANNNELLNWASSLRDEGFGSVQSYSPKVFIPLTKMCRDRCHYCTFARPPQKGESAYLTPEQVLEIAREGAKMGCTEALFTLGDKPELRYASVREELNELGHETTLSYLAEMCALALKETGLLPHVNAGVMTKEDMAALRKVSASQGLMLETLSDRLSQPGGPHYRSPDKDPARRLETIRYAGELAVPFTTGILIGIGETRDERIDALLAIRELHQRYGHIQEIIIQNFRAKDNTPMRHHPEPGLDDLRWTIAVARIIFGPEMNIQAPPNLSPETFPLLISAGINDWGGVSPVTPDHVNPEAPWPEVERLQIATASVNKTLVKRLPLYPAYCQDAKKWQDAALLPHILAHSDAEGFSRDDDWAPGKPFAPQVQPPLAQLTVTPEIEVIINRALEEKSLSEDDLVTLFHARGADLERICTAADELRKKVNGDVVTYVVNRNVNYTNICIYKCSFCAFSKGNTDDTLRGKPYDLNLNEIIRRIKEAQSRGATEVCLQGGIHPHYTGDTYLTLCRAIKAAVPDMAIHAFSPLEIAHGAETLNISLEAFLIMLKEAGLSTLPGTAAEILDDEVRAEICPDKLTTNEWLNVIEAAHKVGFRTTSTIMFGHVDTPRHWARHILHIRALQERTGGFTEFVPLPFVHMEAPMSLKGRARYGPTFREVRLMHAVARLAFHPVITNIQTSWVKLGQEGVSHCLQGGVNDLGGTLMNESISRAAGTKHGQEFPPERMEQVITSLGRIPHQRTTVYGNADEGQKQKSLTADSLTDIILTTPKRRTTNIQPPKM